jgi:RNA polymerase sigma-70 factor (sigma-E family)
VRETSETEFAEFFAATWPRLFRAALAMTGDVGHAEDALQSAYAKAYASWNRVRGADHPEAYVRRMAVNEVLGVRRRAWWRGERGHHATGAPPEPARAGSPPTEGILDRDEMWTALQALPPRQRAVLVLRYYEDLSEQQTAAALGCSVGTVKSQASTALASLRRRHAAGSISLEEGRR